MYIQDIKMQQGRAIRRKSLKAFLKGVIVKKSLRKTMLDTCGFLSLSKDENLGKQPDIMEPKLLRE